MNRCMMRQANMYWASDSTAKTYILQRKQPVKQFLMATKSNEC